MTRRPHTPSAKGRKPVSDAVKRYLAFAAQNVQAMIDSLQPGADGADPDPHVRQLCSRGAAKFRCWLECIEWLSENA